MEHPLRDHFPLSQFDELPLHQSLEPIRMMATTDPRAFDRYWFAVHAEDGSFYLSVGLGVYPNLATTDAFVLLVRDGRQTTMRAHARLANDRAELQVGPIKLQLIDAFREWNVRVEDNEHAFTLDYTWRDTRRAIFHRIPEFQVPGVMDFRLLHNWGGYETFGTAEGSVCFGDEVIRFNHENTRGSRDHHWGTRNGIGGPGHGLEEPPAGPITPFLEFADWSVWGWRSLPKLDEKGHASQVAMLDRRLRFDSDHHLLSGMLTFRLGSGEIKVVEFDVIPGVTAYLRSAMYTGCNGLGTMEGNIHHGMAVPPGISLENINVNDRETRLNAAGFEDHLVRARCDGAERIGIIETRNPGLYEMAKFVPGYTIEP